MRRFLLFWWDFVVGLWNTFNMIIAGVALGCVAERRQPTAIRAWASNAAQASSGTGVPRISRLR